MERLECIKQDAYTSFGKFNLPVKHFLYSKMKIDSPEDDIEKVLGYKWGISADKLFADTEWHSKAKRRGRYVGEELNLKELETLPITKTLLSRLNGQCHCFLGIFLAPVQSTLRISFSKLCQETDDWNQPLHTLNPELDADIRSMLCNIVDLKNKINPLSRAVIPPNYELTKIVCSTDSSSDALGFTIHFVSEDPEGWTTSRLAMSRCSVHKLSIPAS